MCLIGVIRARVCHDKKIEEHFGVEEDVWWNCPFVVREEGFFPYDVLRWPTSRVVASFFEQLFHAVAVFPQDFLVVSFWLCSRGEPPESGEGVFNSDAFDVYPLRRSGQACRIETDEFLTEVKVGLFLKS